MSTSKCRNKRKVWSPRVLLLLELTAPVLMLPFFSSAAQENTTPSAYQLRPGVIVDPDRHLIYIMSVEGGIDAVDLARGTRAWSTKQAAKPLALAGRLLICQAEAPSEGNELQIVTLDTGQQGKLVVTGTAKLPVDVNVSIDETLTNSFVASARVSGAVAYISWAHSKRFMRGIPPGFPDVVGVKIPLERTVNEPSVASGTFRMDLSTGVVSPVKQEEIPVAIAAASRPPDLSRTERLARIEGPQFRSANGRHVLNSQRIADDSVWEKYRWTIYDRGTGERVGEFRTHLSFAPFFIFDSQIIYETGPYVRRTDKGAVDEPLKIRAVDLRTGQELWTWQVRDTTFRGPFPP